jgi:hypothetical protein
MRRVWKDIRDVSRFPQCGTALPTAFLCAVVWLLAIPASANQIAFNTLPPGTVLNDQLLGQGIRFVPYLDIAQGQIVSVPGGNVARFDYSAGTEFYARGAHAIFKDFHQSLVLHVGLAPKPELPGYQAQLVLTAYDAGNNPVGTATAHVTAGAGYSTEMRISTGSPNILSFVLDAPTDAAKSAPIAIMDIAVEDPTQRTPDYVLDAPPGVAILAGGPPVDVPVLITRVGGSVGAVQFGTPVNLPVGVTATFTPNPSSIGGSTMRLIAPPTAASSAEDVTLTATPLSPTAGPAPRTTIVTVAVSQALAISGPADVDLGGCHNSGGTAGTLDLALSVVRDYRVMGNVQLSISGLPANVKAELVPSELAFPGGLLGAASVLRFTATAGIAIADTPVQVEATNGIFSSIFTLDVHGTCPRHNQDFLIRGAFLSNHLGTITPIVGAIVQAYRYSEWWYDEPVGSPTATGKDGSYEIALAATDHNTYYAKLRLNGGGVYLRDWWTKDNKYYDTPNKGNNTVAVIDLGATTISRDNGAGTPKSSVWQGGRAAWQEFLGTMGTAPPLDSPYEIVNQNTVSGLVWTARSTTNWEDNTRTWFFTGSPIAESDPKFDTYFSQFDIYSVNFHEFGHAIRHTVDGDINHFNADDSRYGYARYHTYCGSGDAGVHQEGFAFNEGWAEYWAHDRPNIIRSDMMMDCPAIGTSAMNVEGAVALDLNKLDRVLVGCSGVTGSAAESAQAGRRAMFAILSRGQDIIHSDEDFRRHFALQFSGCAPPPVSALMVPGRALVLSAGVAGQADQRAHAELGRRDPAKQLRLLQDMVDSQKRMTTQLSSDLQRAEASAQKLTDTRAMPPKQFLAQLLRPALLQGQIEVSQLLEKTFVTRLDAEKAGLPPEASEKAEAETQLRLAAFDTEVRAILIRASERALAAIAAQRASDRTGALVAATERISRDVRLMKMKTPIGFGLMARLKLPAAIEDDVAQSQRAGGANWTALGLLAILAALGYVVVAVARRKRNQV